MRECNPGGLKGRKIAISWAYSPSYAKPLSVAQGCSMLFTRFGAEVVLAHPEGYHLMPDTMEFAHASAKASGGSFRVTNSMDDAFAGADIVYPKSWGAYDFMLQRVEANRSKDKTKLAEIEKAALAGNAQHKDWICDERRMGLTKGGGALYMHPLPADIGSEVSHGVMRQHSVNVARQAQYKMYVIMALLAVAKAPDLAKRLEALAK
jgi:ornithine carbamoyltransferase